MRTLRRHITKLAVMTLMAVAAPAAHAQADAMIAHYMEAPAYYNPGAIGVTDNLYIRGGARLQWLGIENAPTTFFGTANMPFKLFNKKFGVGLMMQQESEGLYKNLTLGAQLAYKFKVLKGELTAGLQIGLIDENFQGSKVVLPDGDDYHESTDDAIPTNDVHGTALDLGVGVFYSHKYFWAGVSCTHVNSPTVKMEGEGATSGAGTGGVDGEEGEGTKNFEFTADRTLYFMAGSNIPIKNTLFEVMPSVMVASNFTFTTAQANLRTRFRKFLTVGVGYRLNDAVIAMASAVYRGIFIGYSFEYSVSPIGRASNGSHELMLGYSMKLDFSEKNKNRHKNIRIM